MTPTELENFFAPEFLLVRIVLLCFASAVVGSLIGMLKGRPAAGFFFGLLLGPIGWLVIAVRPNLAEPVRLTGAPSAPRDDDAAALRRVFDAGLISAVEYDEKKGKLSQSSDRAASRPAPASYRIPGIN